MTLFLGTGLGKGTTTAMIPEVYFLRHFKAKLKREDFHHLASQDTATVVGFSAAVATFGAFLLPLTFDLGRYLGFQETVLFSLFALTFLGCFTFTYFVYGRKTISNPLGYRSLDGNVEIIDSPAKMATIVKEDAA